MTSFFQKIVIGAAVATLPVLIAVSIDMFMDVSILKANSLNREKRIDNLKSDIINRLDRIEVKLDRIRGK